MLSSCIDAKSGLRRLISLSSLSLLWLPDLSSAGTLVGGSQTLTNGAPVEAWTLSQGATLNVEQAQTLGINASHSTLNATGATTQQISVSQGSVVNLSDSTVNGGNARAGVEIINSTGTINASTVTGNRLGLQAARNVSTASGSSISVTDSRITGASGGARATAFSSLDFSSSRVEGTGAGSAGVSLLSGSASARNGTQIVGGQNGVTLGLEGAGLPASQLTLDGASVEGKSGSAVLVDNNGRAAPVTRIDVLDGSTLTGGNGIAVEVKGAADAAINVERSDLVGNVQVSDGSVAALTLTQGSLTGNVTGDASSAVSVGLQQGSQLKGVMTDVAKVDIGGQSRWALTGDSKVGDLNLDGGTVKLGSDDGFHQLNVNNLSGNGLFEMSVDFATLQSDVLNVTGVATGNHQLLIASTGTEPPSGQPVTVVHTAGGDAAFSLANADGKVDLGAFSYGLKADESRNNWFLDPSGRTVSPSTRTVMALFNTAPTVWYGELTSLRSRMGEVRFNQEKSGAWARAYGNKYNVNDAFGDGYRQTQQGFTLGADAPLHFSDGQWLLGVMAGYSTSDLNLHTGSSGTIKSYYAGTYLTWLDEASGYYVDSVLKVNRFRNDAKAGLSDGTRAKGDYDNSAVGGSVEVGRHIKLDDGYFIEPFTQWSAVVIQGRDFDLNNGLRAEGDRTRSLLGKAGATAGRKMQLSDGTQVQPYVRAALVHEFSRNNEVKVNNNAFDNDLSGSRAEVGAGIAVNLSERWQAHAEVDYMNGSNIEMPIGGTLGVQFKW
ncbi:MULTISPECIES: autotransporter outer membrane beta-barrel domain-containing protein [unclassified Pseudomonas]|uniref:autotransporter outer membrane beta-barrel domain-containing protein n=1 Tax=unclassified Pseudomonas TaxID=196821 RepID=UPI000A1D99EF|nr:MULTISPECIES: autotransporter outer membrane beta-barrel domain-containing protein [unclassified Pseudomonas]